MDEKLIIVSATGRISGKSVAIAEAYIKAGLDVEIVRLDDKIQGNDAKVIGIDDLVESDFRDLEIRMLAHLSNEELEAFIEHERLHAMYSHEGGYSFSQKLLDHLDDLKEICLQVEEPRPKPRKDFWNDLPKSKRGRRGRSHR